MHKFPPFVGICINSCRIFSMFYKYNTYTGQVSWRETYVYIHWSEPTEGFPFGSTALEKLTFLNHSLNTFCKDFTAAFPACGLDIESFVCKLLFLLLELSHNEEYWLMRLPSLLIVFFFPFWFSFNFVQLEWKFLSVENILHFLFADTEIF